MNEAGCGRHDTVTELFSAVHSSATICGAPGAERAKVIKKKKAHERHFRLVNHIIFFWSQDKGGRRK